MKAEPMNPAPPVTKNLSIFLRLLDADVVDFTIAPTVNNKAPVGSCQLRELQEVPHTAGSLWLTALSLATESNACLKHQV
jgi:hypothetical protein